jgi:type I restriction enzyme M protein
VRTALFSPAERPGYSQLKIEVSHIKTAIFEHPEFRTFNHQVTECFETWRQANRPRLLAIRAGDRPKHLIGWLAEELLETFRALFDDQAPLIDPYAVYQHLMDYWAETMQDDVDLLTHEGWQAAKVVRLLIPGKDQNGKLSYRESHDFVFNRKRYKADIIPPALMIARYFSAEQAVLDQMDAELVALDQQLETLREEQGGEDGLLTSVIEDGKISKASLKSRLRELGDDQSADDERRALHAYLDLMEQHASGSKQWKAAKLKLDTQVVARYEQLSEDEIKTLVVDDKWLTWLTGAVQGELDRVSQTLTGRIQQLAERYAAPLPQLTDEVEALSAKVAQHLKRMGQDWG